MDIFSDKNLLKEIFFKKELTSDEYLTSKINKIPAYDLADFLESLPDDKRISVWKLIDSSLKGEILLEVHGEVEKQLIDATPTSELISGIKKLDNDEIIDLESRLPKKVIEAIINSMDNERRLNFLKMREYPMDSAGGMMNSDIIPVQANATLEMVENRLKKYRQTHDGLPEHLNSLSVTDTTNKFQGEIALVDIISLPGNLLVSQVMNSQFEPVKISTKAKKIAKIFEDRDLISAPVVDDHNHLVGRITVDDVLDYIRIESEHRSLAQVGLTEKTDLFSSILKSLKNRIFWLGLNLANAFLAAMIIAFFASSIEKIVVLAILMPIVASMSGVVGNQTLTLVTRGIALTQITSENVYLLILKEASVGLVNGLIWAGIVAVIAYIWFHRISISLVFGFSLLLCIFISSLIGTVIPLFLNKLNFDPAIAGGVLIIAISDLLGFFIFLGMATVFLL